MYRIIKQLCAERGISVSSMCDECGISRSTMTELHKGRTKSLSSPIAKKIADYFNVSIDYLSGKEEKPTAEDDELAELIDECRERSDLRALFSLAKDATPDDIRKAIAIIKALKGEE